MTDDDRSTTDRGISRTDHVINTTGDVIATTDHGVSSNPGYHNDRRQYLIYPGHIIYRDEEMNGHGTSYLKQKE